MAGEVSVAGRTARRIARYAAACSLMLLASLVDAPAQNKLLPAAQQAFDRGLAAVQQQQWSLAARYFDEAQKLGGADPRLFLNLALAKSKAGQELQAIAWFNAYLALAPQAENAPSIQNEIRRLKQVVRVKIDRILATAEQAGEKTGNRSYKWSVDKARDVLKGSQAEPLTLVELNDFDAGLAAIDSISDETARNRTLRDIVGKLVEGRFGTEYDRGEDLRQADRFLQRMTTTPDKSTLSRRLRLAQLRYQYDASRANSISDQQVENELIATLETHAQRNKILEGMVQDLINKGNIGAAEATLRRFENEPERDLRTAGLLASIALRSLEMRDATAARSAAQRVLAVPAQSDKFAAERLRAYVGAARAVLGDAGPAKAAAEAMRGRPYVVWAGSKNLIDYHRTGFDSSSLLFTDFLYGAAAFSLAMNGKVDEAIATAKKAQPRGDHQAAFANVAYALTLQGNTGRALNVLREFNANSHPAAHQKSQAIGGILRERARKGDLKTGEDVIALMPGYTSWGESWTTGAQYRVEAWLHLAEAAHRSRNQAAARKYVGDAQNVVAGARKSAELQRTKPSALNDLLERIALTQHSIGDVAGAQRTRADITVPDAPAVNFWLARMPEIDHPWLLDPEKRLADIAKESTEGLPGSIAYLGQFMASALQRLDVLERKAALSWPGRPEQPRDPGRPEARSPDSNSSDIAQREFDLVAQVDTEKVWDAFLGRHPDGPLAELARARRADAVRRMSVATKPEDDTPREETRRADQERRQQPQQVSAPTATEKPEDAEHPPAKMAAVPPKEEIEALKAVNQPTKRAGAANDIETPASGPATDSPTEMKNLEPANPSKAATIREGRQGTAQAPGTPKKMAALPSKEEHSSRRFDGRWLVTGEGSGCASANWSFVLSISNGVITGQHRFGPVRGAVAGNSGRVRFTHPNRTGDKRAQYAGTLVGGGAMQVNGGTCRGTFKAARS